MTRTCKILPIAAVSIGLLIGAAPAENSGDVAKPTARVSPATDQSATPIDASTLSNDATPQLDSHQSLAAPADAQAGLLYAIDWYSVNGGGTVNASSTNFKMGASIGQSVAGPASSASYKMGIGFWYGAGGAGGGGCACDCHADPAPIGSCDGVQDVLDVVQTVNVAFRGAASIVDPNVNCPYETTDVNCSLSTDVIDVVKMVNVAFRGADPNTEFCDPCA